MTWGKAAIKVLLVSLQGAISAAIRPSRSMRDGRAVTNTSPRRCVLTAGRRSRKAGPTIPEDLSSAGPDPVRVGNPMTGVGDPPTGVGSTPTAVGVNPTGVGLAPTQVGSTPTRVGLDPT